MSPVEEAAEIAEVLRSICSAQDLAVAAEDLSAE